MMFAHCGVRGEEFVLLSSDFKTNESVTELPECESILIITRTSPIEDKKQDYFSIILQGLDPLKDSSSWDASFRVELQQLVDSSMS